jgi:hypothetical protein
VFVGGNDHVFEFNEIHHVCTETDDCGALYKGRNPSCRGNQIRFNYWHDIGSSMGHGNAAVYFDDGDGGDTVYGNVFVRCGEPGKGPFGTVFSHGGHGSRAENNVFVDCKRALGSAPWDDARWRDALNGGQDCFFIEKLRHEVDITKPPYTTRYPELVGFLDPPPGAPRVNYARLNLLVRCGEISGGNWQLEPGANWSTADDPGFVDSAKGDYRLRSNAAVYEHLPGFKPVPFEKMGLQRDSAPAAEPAKVTDLRPLWDTERVLRNPYKGWYHHYYDNGTRNYRLSSDDDLDRFPGMDHLYIRLSWAHFEAEEGRYNWSWIDDVKDHWTPKGYGISLRISTCETGEAHATPEWVIAAGAKGAMFKAYRQEVWVPDYGDPVFLAKLDHFVGELARRYDGQPWLRYVDIGLGTWGEGHNFPMFDKAIPMEVVKRHIDIYRAYFRRSVLVLSDDAVHVHGRKPEEEQELKEYATAKGISWRDDSILTWPGLHNWPDQFNVARPELFGSAWRKFPTVLETSHYHEALRDGAYKPTKSGSIRAYDDLRGAIQLTHATYLGYHGDARKWLSDHPDLAKELANKLGYWYFPKSVSLPQRFIAARENTIHITWEDRGTAPAYQRFTLRAQLTGNGGKIILSLEESNNLTWMPGAEDSERYSARIPGGTPTGRYTFSVSLLDTSVSPERIIELGLKEALRGPNGFYRLCDLEIKAP